jgi:hypothetical protein
MPLLCGLLLHLARTILMRGRYHDDVTLLTLKQSMNEEIAAIPELITRLVMEYIPVRLKQCLRNGGRHLSDVLFKT